jgi:hypothetical protein
MLLSMLAFAIVTHHTVIRLGGGPSDGARIFELGIAMAVFGMLAMWWEPSVWQTPVWQP